MTCWALLALKSPGEGKSRLAQALPADEREQLVWAMFEHVVRTLQQAGEIERIAVVTPCPERMPPAVTAVADPGGGLNAALHAGLAAAAAAGADEVLILHADLPALTAAEVDAFIAEARTRDFGIAPDAAESGTNALFLPTATAFTLKFGPGSLRRHLEEARRRALDPAVVKLRGFAIDIDEPADLAQLPALDTNAAAQGNPLLPRKLSTWTAKPKPSLHSPVTVHG